MSAEESGSVTVRVPATSANLGPGFDCAGLALDLCDEVVVRALDGAEVEVAVEGEGAGAVPTGADHLVVRALHSALDALGAPRPGLRMRCVNRIPHGRGLGSSAAAVVAGLLAGRALVPGGERRLTDDAVLGLAAAMEGHPDNAAACLLGGLTLSWSDGGAASAVRLEPRPDLCVTVLVPAEELSTVAARAMLPAAVPHADAAHAAGRSALLVAALLGAPGLLLPATEDLLHQPYRAAGMPRTADLVRTLRAAGRAAVVSGAGPSVVVLDEARVPLPELPPGWRVLSLEVARSGAEVVRR